MMQYFKCVDPATLAEPIEVVNDEDSAIAIFGSGNYLYKDLPDNLPLDIISKDLNAGEVQADAVKQAAKDAQAKAESDNALRATWWASARDGVGSPSIPTLNYLINQGTAYDDYPAILKKILNGIAPTDTEWEAYDATFVIP